MGSCRGTEGSICLSASAWFCPTSYREEILDSVASLLLAFKTRAGKIHQISAIKDRLVYVMSITKSVFL